MNNLNKQEIDRIYRELSFHLDAIQAGFCPKYVVEDCGIGCKSIRYDDSQLREYVKKKEQEWQEFT